MPSGRERLARLFIDRHTSQAEAAQAGGPIAVVTAVTTGGGTDGVDLVTVTHDGATRQYPHLLQYTPVVGHVVALGRWGGTWIILGRPGGFPPNS